MTRRSIVSMLPADAVQSYGVPAVTQPQYKAAQTAKNKKAATQLAAMKDPMAEALFGKKKPAAKKAPTRKAKK